MKNSSSEKPKENQGVAKSALLMSMGTMGSRLLGLVRDILLAAFFSITIKDAFVVAFRLPNLFRRLLGEGSLSVSFLPIYVEQLETQGLEQGQRLASAVWTLLLVVTATLSLLGIIFMEPLIDLLVSGSGYQSIENKLEITVLMARVMFFYLFLVTSYAYLTAVAQAWKKFFLPALAPALFNLGLILFFLFPQDWFNAPGIQLAWGVLFGGVVQLLLVIWQLIKIGKLPIPLLKVKVIGVRQIMINMLPGIAGLGVGQLVAIVNVNFASRLGEGTHAYIYFADRILELPQSLIAISLGAALLPALSRLFAHKQLAEMHKLCHDHLNLMYFLSLPAAVGMWTLSEPIVRVLFKRGTFSESDVVTTAIVLKLYAFLLVASSFVKVLLPSFYAIKNTWYPALVAGICLAIHFVLANIWVDQFGIQGLVGSTVLIGFINGGLLLVGYYKAIGDFHFFQFILKLLPMGLPLAFMTLFLSLASSPLLDFLHESMGTGFVVNLVHLIFMILVSAATYFFFCQLFKVKVSTEVMRAFKRKLKARKSA